MPRLRSPTRTISNSGDVPRFTGVLPSPKAPGGQLVFDSIASLAVAIFLEWCRTIRRIVFESRWYEFQATKDLPAIRCNPDFECVTDTGEIVIREAKSRKDGLSDEERESLALAGKHFAAENTSHDVIFHDQLQANGFIDTIFLLRRYGLIDYSAKTLETALGRLNSSEPHHLERWREIARIKKVPTGVLYHLLYHQQLPITYRLLLHPELLKWRD
jgi:hypothetical protein